MPEVDLGRWRVRYEDHGAGKPLLLIHGLLMTGASWRSLMPRFEGYRTLAPDLPCHGGSSAEDDALSTGALAEMLAAFLDGHGLGAVHVAGHSFGGALAIRLAADFPGRVRSLCLLNSNAAAGDEEWQARSRARLPRMAQRLRAEGMAALRDSGINASRNRRFSETDRAQIEMDFESSDPEALARFMERTLPQAWGIPHAPKVTAPVLLLVGTRDAEFVTNHRNLVAALPDVRVVEMEGAGHAAHLEVPDLFVRELLAFLADVEASR